MSSQSRSLSGSLPEPTIKAADPSRSASLTGLTLFGARDSLSFFFKEDSFTESTNASLEESVEEPLDIVGTLGTLNLDADLASPLAAPSAPASSGNLASDSDDKRRVLGYSAMTPNPPSVSGFSGTPSTLAQPSSTPLTTWSHNFVPFSAPPLSYSGDSLMASEMAMQIAPFHLPDDNSTERGAIFQENRPMGSSTPSVHSFGGILDSQYGFGHYMPEESEAQPFEKLPVEKLRSKKKEPIRVAPINMFSAPALQLSGSNVWNQNLRHIPDFPIDGFKLNGTLNDLNPSDPRHRMGRSDSVKNEAGYLGSSRNYHQNRNRSYNYHINSGVNVHRKAHSSHKRKGEDAAKYANAKLEDFTGEIYTLCKDQHGCRFLQRQLDLDRESVRSSQPEKSGVVATMIFNEIYLKIVELMADPFGNYLIQKLFENVSDDQRLILVKNSAADLFKIALDPHGTRALQKLVECVTLREESDLVIQSLAPHVVSLSRDLNGNHVVQRCLQKLKPKDNQFIFDAASEHCAEIAMHRHGCCVLQRCLDHGDASQRRQLSVKVAEIATVLSLDPFGNYVVQYVLSRGNETSIAIILDHILANIIHLSLHKFGSNVIEKSLRISKLTNAVIAELLKNSKQFSLLLNDPFGNYVLQTSLDVANKDDLSKLAEALLPYLASIRNTPHGRRILTKIQSIP